METEKSRAQTVLREATHRIHAKKKKGKEKKKFRHVNIF